ncbi:MAG TPA: polysaccharide biosynthesis protein, partial [Gammaproteobacteria bacterium]|nr:polysaccharide biosynthesis protein [Gammaproteobacteria bacterium]
MLKNLFIHFSKYSLSNILIALAGLVSFPILTRMLTVEQYGVMSLIGATLTLVISFGKLGVQHSAIRFYSEINANKSPFNLTQFFSTVLTFSACAA